MYFASLVVGIARSWWYKVADSVAADCSAECGDCLWADSDQTAAWVAAACFVGRGCCSLAAARLGLGEFLAAQNMALLGSVVH